ncbi:hypothetical protein K469DRAFT_715880 [Zopfia rhizophila CBS 207.26]|uniref:Uncharacterized protein n=1 Tax=Zopfia rhizophila CBS 207.26 TaxID=1314779 RepID=A0A6A6DN32_9PEZI|nr:hypothetical protein K469DRAFT_715880 [Zopfia rhizophila CBS 207.26]
MDHWGDPWADDSDSKPPQEEIKSPSPLPTGPVLLNEFIDDAQWDSVEQDDGFGAWATSPSPKRYDPAHTKDTETCIPESSPESIGNEFPDLAQKDDIREEYRIDNEGWGSLTDEQETPSNSENVVSEASDSATTIQAEETLERHSQDFSDALKTDDDLSTRPSTSPSDISHTEAPSESPRTSFEEERAARKAPEADSATIPEDGGGPKHGRDDTFASSEAGQIAAVASEEDEFGDFEDERDENGLSAHDDGANVTPAPDTTSIAKLTLDPTLLGQLFPPPARSKNLEPAPNDPISTTSARKAWYRLTRKQTMREFNSGKDEDNYVRVTWQTSQIRSEVSKIVGRLGTEDRMAGRGQVAGAMFYWDQPALHSESKTLYKHPRKKSSISVSSPIPPAHQPVQPVSSNVPAAFNWSSSPMASHDPWQNSEPQSPGFRSTSSPIAAKHGVVARVQGHETRSVSVDMSRRSQVQEHHIRTTSAVTPGKAFGSGRREINKLPTPASSTTPNVPAEIDSWEDFSHLDTTPQSKAEPTTIEDDDDDWGDMVQSSAPSTQQLAFEPPQSPHSAQIQVISTASNTPKSIKSSPFQTPASRHASPIVRLKGTVSPTSALFKFNNYLPSADEAQPIGPGILKPVAKSTEGTPEKTSKAPSRLEEPPREEATPSVPDVPRSQDFSPLEDTSATQIERKEDISDQPAKDNFSIFEGLTVPQPEQPKESTTDSFFDADFSIFESNLPATTAIASHSQPHADPLDPFSIFETLAPALFVRPPARTVTPPPKLPLTGASNSAQRRKAEEDEIIRRIVEGLPDLGYMLRR